MKFFVMPFYPLRAEYLLQYTISEHCQPLQARSQNCKKATISFFMCACVSVCQRGTTRFPLDGF